MPDKDGKMTEEELKKAHDWLSKFTPGADTICPICRSSDWYINDRLVQPLTLGSMYSVQLGGIGYPQITMNCVQCGHTVFINAVVAGIVPSLPIPVAPTPENPSKSWRTNGRRTPTRNVSRYTTRRNSHYSLCGAGS